MLIYLKSVMQTGHIFRKFLKCGQFVVERCVEVSEKSRASTFPPKHYMFLGVKWIDFGSVHLLGAKAAFTPKGGFSRIERHRKWEKCRILQRRFCRLCFKSTQYRMDGVRFASWSSALPQASSTYHPFIVHQGERPLCLWNVEKFPL